MSFEDYCRQNDPRARWIGGIAREAGIEGEVVTPDAAALLFSDVPLTVENVRAIGVVQRAAQIVDGIEL